MKWLDKQKINKIEKIFSLTDLNKNNIKDIQLLYLISKQLIGQFLNYDRISELEDKFEINIQIKQTTYVHLGNNIYRAKIVQVCVNSKKIVLDALHCQVLSKIDYQISMIDDNKIIKEFLEKI